MKKHKHEWNYIGNQRIGESYVIANNPEYAIFICNCGKIKCHRTGRE